MRTVKEVSAITGVGVRTLHHYDAVGLLRPTQTTQAGYRLYDDEALERLQMILLFRELEFKLDEIKRILDSPGYDRTLALEQQINLLTMRKEHLENMITFARGIQMIGVKTLDFSTFDTKEMDEYARQAKAAWGKTDSYRQFEEKAKGRSKEDDMRIGADMMAFFTQLGSLRSQPPEAESVQAVIKQLQAFISEHFYQCTPEILHQLGRMYAGGGAMTESIDKAGGEGTAELASKAIEFYCSSMS